MSNKLYQNLTKKLLKYFISSTILQITSLTFLHMRTKKPTIGYVEDQHLSKVHIEDIEP